MSCKYSSIVRLKGIWYKVWCDKLDKECVGEENCPIMKKLQVDKKLQEIIERFG